jgi:putative colanic acid biosynthesis UDP-glucose lipid carrier transferase
VPSAVEIRSIHVIGSSLLAVHDTQPRLSESQPRLTAVLQGTVDPMVAVGTLLISVIWFEGRFDGPYLILMLLVLSLTYPGSVPRESTGAGELIQDIAATWLTIIVLLLCLGWASQTLALFDSRVILAWALVTPLAIFAAHRLFAVVLPRLLAAEGLERTAVIAGSNVLGRELARRLRADQSLGIRFRGYFDDRVSSRLEDVDPSARLGPLSELADYVKAHRVDLIYITLPVVSQPRSLKVLDELRDTTASIYFVPDIFAFDLIQARLDAIGGIPVVAVCETPFYGINAVVKRLIDVALASTILVLISPLMLAIAIGVKLSSPGPALFKQRRYGLDGRQIVIYKFRTMRVVEDGDLVKQATRNDPRVTRFGAFLRRYSLDELPQFINVLQGCMSVVGPRPHAVAHNEMYRRLIKNYMIRHKVKPGITGLAQVNGLRGETDDIEKMKARVEYDLAYLRHWSVLLDLQIILKTTAAVLGKQNAY